MASSATSLLLPHGSYTHSNSNAGCTFDMPHLERIDISDNNFGGKIPGEIFKYLPSLISFAAVANCFTGSLPDSICDAKSLEVSELNLYIFVHVLQLIVSYLSFNNFMYMNCWRLDNGHGWIGIGHRLQKRIL